MPLKMRADGGGGRAEPSRGSPNRPSWAGLAVGGTGRFPGRSAVGPSAFRTVKAASAPAGGGI